jgi:hypothetical protein
MSFMNSRPKKSPSSKTSPKINTRRGTRAARGFSPEPTGARLDTGAPQPPVATQALEDLRKCGTWIEFSKWQKSLPTKLERDTLLMPDAIAESVVSEASRYLNAELPTDFAERLAAKAHRLYPRHAHFHKMLNRPGNRGRDYLYMYMRHWTCSWLKRERYALYKKLPWSYAQGKKLPESSEKRDQDKVR